MPFAAALSTAKSLTKALDEVLDHVKDRAIGRADLAVAFFSPHHVAQAALLAERLQERLQPRILIGCSGEAIVGNDREIEAEPALSLWLGSWPEPPSLTQFRLEMEQTPDGVSLLGWPDDLMTVAPEEAAILLLGDPFSFPADDVLKQINDEHPGLRVMGGMASGGRAPGECRLIQGSQVFQEGAVGVLLRGPVKIRSIVSQGCRPIGKHFVVTKAHHNLIQELGGEAPLARLKQMFQELPTRDQQLFQKGLHIGRVINEYQGAFHRGDFLVRNVLGLERETGSLAITDMVRVGQTVQFHVRDAESADEDLRTLLGLDRKENAASPAGALLFTCNGRGTRLFPEPHHDARAVLQQLGEIPLAGFFAQGELGPIGGQNFIHGFTASLMVFE